MNALSKLIANSTKVKEILKEQSLELGGIKNKCLFVEKFEEKLSKITTAKTEVQNNIYWSPEKFNINILSQPPAVLNKAFYPKTTNEEY